MPKSLPRRLAAGTLGLVLAVAIAAFVLSQSGNDAAPASGRSAPATAPAASAAPATGCATGGAPAGATAATAESGAHDTGSGAHDTQPAAPLVTVYPTPGDRYEQPHTQIVFRGIAASRIGNVTVRGSSSGLHPGRIVADSDGDGASFIPDRPFTACERVTVDTDLDIRGGNDGTFAFRIDDPASEYPHGPVSVAGGPKDVQHFRSAPDLLPVGVDVTVDDAPARLGDIFVAPQFGPLQDGPMILDPHGRLVWFDPYPLRNQVVVTDFRRQRLHGRPVRTWWQGITNHDTGFGTGTIVDDHYHRIATVRAGNGLMLDPHGMLVTNSGDA